MSSEAALKRWEIASPTITENNTATNSNADIYIVTSHLKKNLKSIISLQPSYHSPNKIILDGNDKHINTDFIIY